MGGVQGAGLRGAGDLRSCPQVAAQPSSSAIIRRTARQSRVIKFPTVHALLGHSCRLPLEAPHEAAQTAQAAPQARRPQSQARPPALLPLLPARRGTVLRHPRSTSQDVPVGAAVDERAGYQLPGELGEPGELRAEEWETRGLTVFSGLRGSQFKDQEVLWKGMKAAMDELEQGQWVEPEGLVEFRWEDVAAHCGALAGPPLEAPKTEHTTV